MALQKGPNGLSSVALLKCRLGRVRFLMEQMEDNKLEKIEKRNRHGKIPCKAFSKYLIVKTIG